MTNVYITRTGGKYHATYSCQGLLDAERERGREVERWPVPLKDVRAELSACAVCWPDTVDWDEWTLLAHKVERRGDSPYEIRFVTQVLRKVQGLRPADVAFQQQAEGRSGQRYFIDFVLTAPGGRRVAIEVDGVDKASGEKTPAQVKEDVEIKRADLIEADWRVLNFSNTRISTRPDECVTEIRGELAEVVQPRSVSEPVTPYVAVPTPVHPQTSPLLKDPNRIKRFAVGVLAAVAAVAVGGWWLARAGSETQSPAWPTGQDCPAVAPIKGNVGRSGEKIFHEPGWRYYASTWPEDCFASSEEAKRAGYRASKVK